MVRRRGKSMDDGGDGSDGSKGREGRDGCDDTGTRNSMDGM
jgi:hypothetical protein